MRYLIAGFLVVGLGAASGCASPQRIEAAAARHEMRASQYDAEGQPIKAARERSAAAKDRQKAQIRRQGL
ncbi:MAG: hypothetical protein ACHQ17_12505 [Polyangia bacterium]|jgi:outer membrane murein-binding lipoprotein Lpp